MDESTINYVKEWVDIDNSIRVRREKIKMLYERKNKVETAITSYIQKNKLNDLHINVSDGHVKFVEKNTLQSVTLKFLKEQLDSFFQEAETKRTPINAETVYKYIVSQRKSFKSLEMVREITSAS